MFYIYSIKSLGTCESHIAPSHNILIYSMGCKTVWVNSKTVLVVIMSAGYADKGFQLNNEYQLKLKQNICSHVLSRKYQSYWGASQNPTPSSLLNWYFFLELREIKRVPKISLLLHMLKVSFFIANSFESDHLKMYLVVNMRWFPSNVSKEVFILVN